MDSHTTNRSQARVEVSAMEFRPQTHSWKDVRNFLEKKDDADEIPLALCPICRGAQLDIQGLPLLEGDTNLKKQAAVVTFCGHLACQFCFKEWYKTNMLAKQEVPCRVCRYKLRFSSHECQHTIQGFALPTNGENGVSPDDVSYFQKVPPTLAEGATHPEICVHCQEEVFLEPLFAPIDEVYQAKVDALPETATYEMCEALMDAWGAARVTVIRSSNFTAPESQTWESQVDPGEVLYRLQ